MHILTWPAYYSLEITTACNNRCAGCGNVFANDRTLHPMSAARWKSLLATFASEAVWIRLTGGEPTLHPEFFCILEDIQSYQVPVTIFTNGRWANPARFLKQLNRLSHQTGLLVSLHGARADSHEAFSGVAGSFDETVANVQLAVEHGIPVALSTVITQKNWNELDAVLELAQRLGAQQVAFNRYLGKPLPGVEPTQTEMTLAISKIDTSIRRGAPVKYGIGLPQCFYINGSEGCLAGVAYVAVDPWGNVRPCAHSPTVVGSLREHSMADLWHSPAMNAWRALMPAECTTCAAYSACHGGCRAAQELRPEARDPFRQLPLAEFTPVTKVSELPADARPRARLRLRAEPFGYALLGEGHVVPVRAEARPVIEACDGTATFAELAMRLGEDGINLLGELWELGMLENG